MKVRNGFVSNSSSSSFIIGLGKIKDIGKFRSFLRKKGLKENSEYLYTMTTSELLAVPKCYWDIKANVKSKLISVAANVNSSPYVSIHFDPAIEETFVIVNVGNNEGDKKFWNEHTQELEWDKVNDDWFEGEQAELISLLKSNILENAIYLVGAERNG
jgi:hypothetical protein